MCLLFETMRVEGGEAHFTQYHQRRVDRSGGSIDLASYIEKLDLPSQGVFKLRITYTSQGVVEHIVTPYTTRLIKSLKIVENSTIQYNRKFNDRSDIEQLFALRDECDDIIVTRQGVLTDSSFSNLAMWDGAKWVTPHEPLLAGTCRERLIEQGVLSTARITVESLDRYSKLMLINAMIGWDDSRAIDISPRSIIRI